MKNYIAIAALLAAGTAVANAAEQTVDLRPAAGSFTADTDQNKLSADGISVDQVSGYATGVWYGTYQAPDLKGQVGLPKNNDIYTPYILSLQLGNVSALNKGNYAAVKFEFDALEEVKTAELSFSIDYNSSWGGDGSTFAAKYTATVYGFDDEGNATSLGSWSKDFVRSSVKSYEGDDVSIALSGADGVNYSSYGLVFSSIKTVANGGGIDMHISDIKVVATGSPIPEPSAFGLLAGIGALALVASRRRRK